MTREERKKYNKEYNELKRSLGLCISCGQREIAPNSKSRCEICLAKNAEVSKRYRDNMSEEQKKELTRKKLLRKRIRETERIANGQCKYCEKSVYKDLTVCYEHMLRGRRYARKYHPPKNYTALGLCRICGNQCYEDKKFCKEHYEQYRQSMLSAREYADGSMFTRNVYEHFVLARAMKRRNDEIQI